MKLSLSKSSIYGRNFHKPYIVLGIPNLENPNSADMMDLSADGSIIVEASANGVDIRPSRVRRRLIQSTLFPHKPPDLVVEIDDKQDQDDDEEYCGSQSNKKRKRKFKALAQPRTLKKAATKGKEALGKKPNNEESPVTDKLDFFSKISVKLERKKQKKEQFCISPPKETAITISPEIVATNMEIPAEINSQANATPENCQDKVIPKKRRASVTPKRQKSTPKLILENMESPVEINSQANATAENCQDKLTPKKRRASMTPKKKQISTPKLILENMESPIDMNSQANTTPEKCQAKSTPKKRSVTPKKKQKSTPKKNSINGSPTDGQTLCEYTSIQIPNLRLEEKLRTEENSRMFSGKQIHPFFSSWKAGKRNLNDVEGKCCWTERNNNNNFSPIHVFEKVQDDSCSLDWGNWNFADINSEFECEYSSIYQRSVKSLQFEICRNKGSSDDCPIQVEEDREVDKVKHFSEQAGGENTSGVLEQRTMSYYRRCANQPENSMWTNKYQPEKSTEICGNRSSVEIITEWLHHWHGKGFRTNKSLNNGVDQTDQDFDYNFYQSDCDSGDIGEEDSLKNVLLVTGPVGSGKSAAIYACAKQCGFQVIEVNASDWRNGALVKQKFGEAVESHWHQCVTESQGSENKVIEVVSLTDGDTEIDYTRQNKSDLKENGTGNDQTQIKTLILFEDIDATLYEDRGFISTIQQLAETAKRPIILTTNSNNPILPNNLDKVEVSFEKPSKKELLELVYMVCGAEEAKIQPCLVERFIQHCESDIRKTIMNLQFWCQGQTHTQRNKVKKSYTQVEFSIDTAHQILPKLIPFVFPSLLAEIVHIEITKSLTPANESPSLTTIVEELNGIDAKKEEILKNHSPDRNDDQYIYFGSQSMVSNSIDSPIAFARRNIRSHKFDAIVSSDSDEECTQINDTVCNLPCQSFDVSCVPDSLMQQSSFVPETEINDGSTSMSATISCANNDGETLKIFCNDADLNIESIQKEGEGDSLVERVDSVTREYQAMDECSRIDFSVGPTCIEKPSDFVQETWRKFRECDMGLRQYATLEQECTPRVLELSCGMTNLISEADLLLNGCQELNFDSLEPSMVPCDKSHSYNWCEDQLMMTSAIAQHGMCLYAKEISAVRSNIDSSSSVDLSWEMLASSSNTTDLGKLISQVKTTLLPLNTDSSKTREKDCNYQDIVKSIVPEKSYMALKGDALHEYLSSLSAISRSETSRLSQGIDQSNKRRRIRKARNYLTTGALDLSPEQISLLAQYNYHS